ncbi:hypothetical protein [Treponema ruminis]|uniref:Peptidase M30, hyicolysin n=1 Tax=Treponema ruminis TaxID=744515 RepID=A0A7W8LL30_9SPIR|nr:hypothetical protein [Treponema ruminis]MBB5224986.1 hypothetical protein [Treponema ruminis]
MKKLLVSVLAIAFFSLSSCNNIMDQVQEGQTGTQTSTQTGTDKSGQLIEATKTSSVKYQHDDDKPNIIEVSSDTSKLEISGLKTGQKIWLSRTNPTNKSISSIYTRYVDSASNITLSKNKSSFSREAVDLSPSFSCMSLDFNASLPSLDQLADRSAYYAAAGTVEEITPVVNETEKTIYLDKDSKIEKFEKKKITLRAIGKYCYVWVAGDKDDTTYWTDGGFVKSTQNVNSEIVQKMADCFDKVYPLVRKVFGNESDEMYFQAGIVSMKDYSDTGTKVNIVIHDIGNDFGNNSSSGMVGYFHGKDFHHNFTAGNLQYSNSGKYIYIDAYYAANNTNTVLSTLAHEFQHMIHFGIKTINKRLPQSTSETYTWYNEMKSMLCEDIMMNYFKKLFPKDFTEEDSPFQRLPLFCRYYHEIGLEYQSSGNKLLYSYANNYAFGAWAMRNYGGLYFVKQMATNDSLGVESIQDAAGVSIEEMLKEYTAALLIKKEGYGFNKKIILSDTPDFAEFLSDDYDYTIDAIDLWNLSKIVSKSYYEIFPPMIYFKDPGPVCFVYNARYDLRPYGIGLVSVGTVNFADENESSVTLNFNTTGIDSAQKTYIIIE